jgi:hypothetical protein
MDGRAMVKAKARLQSQGRLLNRKADYYLGGRMSLYHVR